MKEGGYIMRTTNIRFTGLASGLDTESLVTAMITPYQMKVDSATQQQKLLELKKDAWKEMNSKIYSFYKDTLGPLRLNATFNQKTTTISHPGFIEIDNNGSFPDGTHKIQVKRLAEGASVNTKKIEVDINNDGTVDEQDKIAKSTKLTDLKIKEGTTIKIGAESIEVSDKTTIKDLESTLQKAGFSANFDESAGAFFISTKGTGGDQKIQLEVIHPVPNTTNQSDTEVFSALGILPEGSNYTYSGKPALITYNGIEIESQTNNVTVNGMNIKLLAESNNQNITVVSQTDVNSMVDTVVKFVDEYNKLIDEMNTKVNASYNKDYLPLTDEQKKEMSEEDIKLWNEKINSSILRKDPVLQAITSSMREIIGSSSYTDNNGNKFTLQSFGIGTSKNWKEGGKLYIDEDTLRKKVAENPDEFKALFTNRVDADAAGIDKAEALKQSGIGVRLYEDITERLKGTTLKSAESLFNDKHLEKEISNQKDEVAKLEDRMARMESMYYKQFTAMEKMLSQLNNQSSWLTSQLGGM